MIILRVIKTLLLMVLLMVASMGTYFLFHQPVTSNLQAIALVFTLIFAFTLVVMCIHFIFEDIYELVIDVSNIHVFHNWETIAKPSRNKTKKLHMSRYCLDCKKQQVLHDNIWTDV